MRVVVTFEVFRHVIDLETPSHLRQHVAERLRQLVAAANIECSGVYAAKRGGFFVGTFESSETLFAALGAELIDRCKITVQPVVHLHELERFFTKHPAGELA